MDTARESTQTGVRGFLGILHSNVLGAAAPAAVHAFAGLLDVEKGAQHHQSQHCGEVRSGHRKVPEPVRHGPEWLGRQQLGDRTDHESVSVAAHDSGDGYYFLYAPLF